jgi:hypothetical protein
MPKGGEESQGAPSATYDAFIRMQTGQSERTIADKINDPNRVSWETFKRENANKLDLGASDARKMLAYRRELDKERDRALATKRHRPSHPLDDSEESGDDSRKHRERKHRRKKGDSGKKRKHSHKEKERGRKDRRHRTSSSSEDEKTEAKSSR